MMIGTPDEDMFKELDVDEIPDVFNDLDIDTFSSPEEIQSNMDNQKKLRDIIQKVMRDIESTQNRKRSPLCINLDQVFDLSSKKR